MIVGIAMALLCAGCGGKSGSFSNSNDQQAAALRRQQANAEKLRVQRSNENKQLQDYNNPPKQPAAPDQTQGN
jgi:hypothetical protein